MLLLFLRHGKTRNIFRALSLILTCRSAANFRPVLMECDYVFFACPSHALRDTCLKVSEHKEDSWNFRGAIALCKGLEPKSNLFAHEVMLEVLGERIGCGYLTGPSHAHDVAAGKPGLWFLL